MAAPRTPFPRPPVFGVSRFLAVRFGFFATAILALTPHAAIATRHLQGSWTQPFTLFPPAGSPYASSGCLPYCADISVHTALLPGNASWNSTNISPTARLVYWGSSFTARSWMYDPASVDPAIVNGQPVSALSTTTIPITDGSEIFCAGHCLLEDGRLLVFGGSTRPGDDAIAPTDSRDPLPAALKSRYSYNIGSSTTYAFDPSTASTSAPFGWSRLADFTEGRWYPTGTTLGDGTVLLSSGNQGYASTVFGGETGTSTITSDLRVLEDFITFNPTTPSTSPIPSPWCVTNCSPEPTTDYGATYDSYASFTPLRRTIIFGGRKGTGSTNDMWSLRRFDGDQSDPSITDKWRWRKIVPLPGPVPSPRSAMDLVYDGTSTNANPRGSLAIIGGKDANGTALAEVWRFKLDDRNAGDIDGHFSNTNSGSWSNITPATVPAFEPRYGHCSVLIPNPSNSANPGWIVTLFGYDNATQPAHYVDDHVPNTQVSSIWAFDLDTQSWMQKTVDEDPLYPAGQGRPSPREGASAVYSSFHNTDPAYGECIIVFGGTDGTNYFGDTWRLDVVPIANSHWQWKKIGPFASCTDGGPGCLTASPSPRARAAITVDSLDRKRIMLFGGENASGKLSDAWALPMTYWSLEPSAVNQWLPISMNGTTEGRAGHKLVFQSASWNSRRLERFNPVAGTWTKYSLAPIWLPAYPFVFQLPEDGQLFFAAPDYYNRVFNANLGSWSSSWVANPPEDDITAFSFNGATAVMFRPGQILKFGGSATVQNVRNNAGECIDLTAGLSAAWVHKKPDGTTPYDLPDGEGRYHHNLTILPDGTVLMTGGTDGSTQAGPDTVHARRTPWLWTPDSTSASGAWTAMLREGAPRGYHSTAVLLPDARVLCSGGSAVASPIDPDVSTAEIYSPRYLYDASDAPIALSARPQISACPHLLTYAASPATFTVTVSVAEGRWVDKVALVRVGATTHANNMDQRYLPLAFTRSGNLLTVKKETTVYGSRVGSGYSGYSFASPTSGPNVAPPGTYMLFIVDNTGVPSVAWWVKIDPVAPAASAISVSGTCHTVTASWTSPGDDGNIGTAASYNFRVSNTPIFTETDFSNATPVPRGAPQLAGTQELSYTVGLPPGGKVYFALKTSDAAGNVSPMTTARGGVPNTPYCEDDPPFKTSIAPKVLMLLPPRPSPATDGVEFEYLVPEANGGQSVHLDVFDAAGRRVFGADGGQAKVGSAVVTWDLRNQRGARVHAGLYFVRLQVGVRRLQEKLTVK